MDEYEWNEAKRLYNIDKHDLDFRDAPAVLEAACLLGFAKTVAGEHRLLATGTLGDVYVTIIYTMRANVVRVISMRRARDEERRQYCEIYP